MRVIDSHTEGEPTRVVVSGGPDLGTGPLAERRTRLMQDHDAFRRHVILEPRGHEAMVGALLCAPHDRSCAAGVIFFNNEGTLGMCGHGTIGLAVTLAHLKRLAPGAHRIETPVGVVTVDLLSETEAEIENVPSYRHAHCISVEVPGYGTVLGDVAWGGNWFFLCKSGPNGVDVRQLAELTRFSLAVQKALADEGITGADGGAIDHIEVFGWSRDGGDSRSFVLCPGGAFDRSPCGTGTSAKLACLASDGLLQPGRTWVQESVTGGRFMAQYRRGEGEQVIVRIRGRAFVVKDATLLRHPNDPYADGFRTA
ncbi:MAG: proline racemase family protein [Rhizobiales bacterium]|nr:proline racemase family protein [Hyphomicrobiales bacterium]